MKPQKLRRTIPLYGCRVELDEASPLVIKLSLYNSKSVLEMEASSAKLAKEWRYYLAHSNLSALTHSLTHSLTH